MADMPVLSRISPVPVREVWAHEAHYFTQWLLLNSDVLSDVLGMDWELTAAEQPLAWRKRAGSRTRCRNL
jgi:hypothetical protein